jgi:hypothetical protein
MKRCIPVQYVLATGALLFQIVPPLLYYSIYTAAYGAGASMSTDVESVLSHAAILSSALVGMTLACLATYQLLRKSSLGIAVLFISICCLPAYLLASIYLYAELFLQAVV